MLKEPTSVLSLVEILYIENLKDYVIFFITHNPLDFKWPISCESIISCLSILFPDI